MTTYRAFPWRREKTETARRDQTKARLKSSGRNSGCCSFMSGIKDTQWHHLDSNGLGNPIPAALQIVARVDCPLDQLHSVPAALLTGHPTVLTTS